MRTKIAASRAQEFRRLPMFAPLTDAELAQVARLVVDVAVPAGHVLTREGSVAREAFVIVDGEADVTISGRSMGRLGPGDMVGEVALLGRGLRTATVTAVTAMKLLVVDPASFGSLLDNATVSLVVLQALVSRLRSAESK